jgi:hypothetical protein
MEGLGEPGAHPPARAPIPRHGGHGVLGRWGIAVAVAFFLGVGVGLGSLFAFDQARATSVASGTATAGQPLLAMPGALGAQAGNTGIRHMPGTGPSTPGQCGGELTVTRVTNRTITVTQPDGSTATLYVTGQTQYTRSGQAATLSAVVVGSRIYVAGTCAHNGRTIRATSIQIAG